MRIQWRVTFLVLFILVATMGALSWKTLGYLTSEKTAHTRELSYRQLAPLKRLVAAKLDLIRNQMLDGAEKHGSLAPTFHGGLEAVSLVNKTQELWTPAWVDKNIDSHFSKWPLGQDQTVLGALPFDRLVDGEVAWVRTVDFNRQAVYAVMFFVEAQKKNSAASDGVANLPEQIQSETKANTKAVLVGLFSQSPLASLTDDFIGEENSIMLVDDRGYVAAHRDKNQVGALFNEDHLVKQILRDKKLSGEAAVDDMEGRATLSFFQKIDRTNLYLINAFALQGMEAGTLGFLRMLMVIGGAAILLALVLSFFVGSRITGSIESLQVVVAEWARGNFKAAPVQAGDDEVGVLGVQLRQIQSHLMSKAAQNKAREADEFSLAKLEVPKVDLSFKTDTLIPVPPPLPERDLNVVSQLPPKNELRMPPLPSTSEQQDLSEARASAYKTFAEGLVSLMKLPVSSMLGHIQLAKTKTQDQPLKEHLSSLEREVRKTKELVDRLTQFAGAERFDLQPTELKVVTQAALRMVEPQAKASGVSVETQFNDVPLVLAHAEHLQTVIVTLAQNAIQAMKKTKDKRLRVLITLDGGRVQLAVLDTGEGMNEETQRHIFEPFFKGTLVDGNLGLSLALCNGIIKNHGGEVSVSSEVGVGSRFNLSFPISAVQTIASPGFASNPQTDRPLATLHVTPTEVPSESVVSFEFNDEKQDEEVTGSALKKLQDEWLENQIAKQREETSEPKLAGRSPVDHNLLKLLPNPPGVEEFGETTTDRTIKLDRMHELEAQIKAYEQQEQKKPGANSTEQSSGGPAGLSFRQDETLSGVVDLNLNSDETPAQDEQNEMQSTEVTGAPEGFDMSEMTATQDGAPLGFSFEAESSVVFEPEVKASTVPQSPKVAGPSAAPKGSPSAPPPKPPVKPAPASEEQLGLLRKNFSFAPQSPGVVKPPEPKFDISQPSIKFEITNSGHESSVKSTERLKTLNEKLQQGSASGKRTEPPSPPVRPELQRKSEAPQSLSQMTQSQIDMTLSHIKVPESFMDESPDTFSSVDLSAFTQEQNEGSGPKVQKAPMAIDEDSSPDIGAISAQARSSTQAENQQNEKTQIEPVPSGDLKVRVRKPKRG